MTTPISEREADRAALAYRLALANLGVKVASDAVAHWASAPNPANVQATDSWVAQAVGLTLANRSHAVSLAIAFYRLFRALRTGTTVSDPAKQEPTFVNLDTLRQEFTETVSSELSQQQVAYINQRLPADPRQGRDHTTSIRVDTLPNVAEQQAADEAHAEQEARGAISNLGPGGVVRGEREIDTSQPANEVDAKRQEIARTAGARQAAASSRIAMNGGRSTNSNHASNDPNAIGYIRVSLTGTPCGWCAMLISRGPVYVSKSSAEFVADGGKYHDNCNCEAIPVYSEQDYENNPDYALNRYYENLWPQVTAGYSGDEALTVWRRYIREHGTAVRAAAA